MKDLICSFAYPQEILIQFCLGVTPLFELRNLTNIKDVTQKVLQRNSTETTQQNFF